MLTTVNATDLQNLFLQQWYDVVKFKITYDMPAVCSFHDEVSMAHFGLSENIG